MCGNPYSSIPAPSQSVPAAIPESEELHTRSQHRWMSDEVLLHQTSAGTKAVAMAIIVVSTYHSRKTCRDGLPLESVTMTNSRLRRVHVINLIVSPMRVGPRYWGLSCLVIYEYIFLKYRPTLTTLLCQQVNHKLANAANGSASERLKTAV